MIQFTLGSILLALTLFFGGKDLLANNDIIANLERNVSSESRSLKFAKATEARFLQTKDNAILNSADLKTNLLNQLNINHDKYAFNYKEDETKSKFLQTNTFSIEGSDSFARIFDVISDIEKVKGLDIDSVCFNCEVSTKNLIKQKGQVSFKIEGKAYVYNQK